ncbi:MAG TPA: outer membrane protein assembly factor BamA [Flavobacterium sp.]|nr:outer membrane protein assembly factor BamA [Flavobacterium sp.]
MNKYNKTAPILRMALFIAFLLFGNTLRVLAQERLPFDQGSSYILADVNVTGKVSFSKQAIVTVSGLQKGKSITVPGEEIANAVKKLGNLGLFSDIDFYVNKIEGDSIWLELNMYELPKLNDVKITGVRKNKAEELIKEAELTKGKVVNENFLTTTKNYFENKYKKDGYYNAKVAINNTVADSTGNVNMVVRIDRGKKIKISHIEFEGNKQLSDAKLRKALKNTKQINPIRIFKRSKFVREKYQEDLETLVSKYGEKGYRDARVVSDTVSFDKDRNRIAIKINVEEGNKYYFGNIKFLGNSVYSDEVLNRILGIKKGDTYNSVLLQKKIADKSDPDANDITNLYQNSGYLFSQVNAVETRTYNDTIDFEIRVMEGPVAYFNKITVVGNDKTNDKVIYRELYTKPGQKYSKEDLVRSIREIGALGFFDPEAIEPKFKNVDAAAGTVDIEYNVVEKGSSQIELQGGYGGGGFIGTLGLSFNNFAMKDIFKKDAYKPLPMGDGQKVSLRLQGSSFFQTYSLSFSEPWFGGRKPVSFSTSLAYSKQYLNAYSATSGFTNRVNRDRSFSIISLNVGIAKKLTAPDNYFILSQGLNFQYYNQDNYQVFSFDGSSRNFAYIVSLTRNSKAINPIFPTRGSEFTVSAKLTPPYSLFNGVDYKNLGNQRDYKLQAYEVTKAGGTVTTEGGGNVNETDYVKIVRGDNNSVTYESVGSDYASASASDAKLEQKKFNWLEYYKIKFKADWYTQIFGKFVFRSLGEFGFLGAYDNNRGLVPFERFYLGGDGLANFTQDGRETIQLRGYPNQSLTPFITDRSSSNYGAQQGATIYNKFSFELRYPLTLKQSASIYALTFAEAGAGYNTFGEYNPFVLQRSAGFGLRVFMPAFGLLGIDFGYGFDAAPNLTNNTRPNGWETHFIIGQQF